VRRLLVPGLSTLAMLAVLLGLGTWQVQRLHWKQGLLADIDRAEAAPAVDLGAAPPPFAKVRVTGRFRAGVSGTYGAEGRDLPAGPTMGADVLAVLDRPNAPPILVDRGWAPTGAPPVETGEVTVEGYIRPPEQGGLFTPAADAAGRHFYALDPPAIGHALGVDALAPFTLVAMGPPGMPDPVRHLPRPPNDHLGYAITWYSLAAVLAVIFALHARKVVRA
jgi:surfeit locus 1 family protein